MFLVYICTCFVKDAYFTVFLFMTCCLKKHFVLKHQYIKEAAVFITYVDIYITCVYIYMFLLIFLYLFFSSKIILIILELFDLRRKC